MDNTATTLLREEQTSSLIEKFERTSSVILGLVILYSFVMGLAKVASTPLWNDEIITWDLVRQPNVSILYKALARGADGQPPLFYMVEKPFSAVIANLHIALRLPSILAFCATLACVYAFAKRRGGSGLGVICVFILMNTSLYGTYATEARPYSLVAACLALALVCYQRAPALLWTPLLGLSLALSTALHYYAVFALVAFALAEAVFCLSARKLRIGVWTAVFCGAIPVLVYLPLITEQRRALTGHIWAPAKLSTALSAYGNFFSLPVSLGIGFAGLLALSMVLRGSGKEIPGEEYENRGDVPLQEQVLLLGLLGMPFFVYAVARVMHGGFLDRYVLWAVLAMVVIPSYTLPRFRTQSFLVLAVFFLAAATKDVFTLNSLRNHIGRIDSPASSVEQLVNAAGSPKLPVVVGSNNDYIELSYYASPGVAKRLVAIEDRESAVAYIGTDSSDRELPVLADYVALQVYDFHSFAAKNREFLLYSASESATSGPFGFFDRWVPKLLKDGYSLSTVAAEGNRRIYLVRAPAAGP